MIDAAKLKEATEFVARRATVRPRVGLILGSGMAAVTDGVVDAQTIPYGLIPNLPQPTVPGHPGELVVGRLGGGAVAALRGRVHFYEGYGPAELGYPVRLLRALGCEILVVTNAAGALNPAFALGDLMLIRDHIFLPGLAGANPLAGSSGFGEPRFVDMADAYDSGLAARARRAAERRGIPIRDGVYVMVAGPSYETPAELRFLRSIGGDAVGMSTCPEVVVARQLGMRVLGVSVITNAAFSRAHVRVDHLDVLRTAAEASRRLGQIIADVVADAEL